MKPTVAVLYGDAAAAALVYALKAWRTEYAPNRAYEGMIGESIKVVQSKVRLLPGPRATIVIEIEGVRYGTNDAYYFDVEMKGGEIKLKAITED